MNIVIDAHTPRFFVQKYIHVLWIIHSLFFFQIWIQKMQLFCRCISTQVDRDGRTILYTTTETIKLQVEKLIIPPPVSLTQKIGIISAVLLAIIFLILCCVFILFAICKKRRRQKRSRYVLLDNWSRMHSFLYNLTHCNFVKNLVYFL